MKNIYKKNSYRQKNNLQRNFEKMASSNWSTSSCLSTYPQFKGYKIPKLPKMPKCLIIYFYCKKVKCIHGLKKHARRKECF